MERIGNNLAKKQPAILILADFSDGSWHAIDFAMRFLYTPESTLFILQTFQNPNFGQLMVRNIIPRLKKITKYELNVLRTKVLRHFKIKAKQIKLLSFNGELVSILQSKLNLKYTYDIVIGTNSSFADSNTMQNLYVTKIINYSNSPLFILPQIFEQKEGKKILLVANPFKRLSLQVKDRILSICEKTNSELDILFVIEKDSQEIGKEEKAFFEKCFEGIKYTINYTKNTSVSKGIKNYVKNNYKDLIIIEKNQPEENP